MVNLVKYGLNITAGDSHPHLATKTQAGRNQGPRSTHLDSKRSDPSHTDEDHHVKMDGVLNAHARRTGTPPGGGGRRDAVAVEKARTTQ